MIEKKSGKPKKKTTKKPTPIVTDEYKILQEIKKQNEILVEIKDILDNTWRGRLPK